MKPSQLYKYYKSEELVLSEEVSILNQENIRYYNRVLWL